MSTINDIAKMEEELASLRLARQTDQHMLSMQDFELRSLRSDNITLRGRIEEELMRGRELDTLLRTLSAGLVSGLAIYANGRNAAAAARQGALEPEPGAEACPEPEPLSTAFSAGAEPEGTPRLGSVIPDPDQRVVPEAVERFAPRRVLGPPMTAMDVATGLPSRTVPRQVVQHPLEERLALAADGIGRPHRTPIPGGPEFVDQELPPMFLRNSK
jgi:hypothetical protein